MLPNAKLVKRATNVLKVPTLQPCVKVAHFPLRVQVRANPVLKASIVRKRVRCQSSVKEALTATQQALSVQRVPKATSAVLKQ